MCVRCRPSRAAAAAAVRDSEHTLSTAVNCFLMVALIGEGAERERESR